MHELVSEDLVLETPLLGLGAKPLSCQRKRVGQRRQGLARASLVAEDAPAQRIQLADCSRVVQVQTGDKGELARLVNAPRYDARGHSRNDS